MQTEFYISQELDWWFSLLFHYSLLSRTGSLKLQVPTGTLISSLRKQTFLLVRHRWGTFRGEEQKFHTHDVKLSGIWSGALIGRRRSYIVLGVVCEWQTKGHKGQMKTRNLERNSQYLWNVGFSRRNIWGLLELVRRWTQHFTKIDQEKRKIEQICIWNPMTTEFIT